MVHGAPDNYDVQKKATTYRLDDMAELAIRLKAISSVDRLGEVIFYDDFSNGEGAGSTSASGTGASHSSCGTIFRTAGWSLKLVSQSAGVLLATRSYTMPYYVFSKFGIEFCYLHWSGVNYILIAVSIYTTEYRLVFQLIIDITSRKIQIQDENGAWQDIDSSFYTTSGDYLFYVIKLVIDPILEKYVRARNAAQTYDLSSYSCRKFTGDYYPYIAIDFKMFSNSGSNGIIYLDSVIITQNEP